MILEICLYSHYYKRRPNAPNLILPDRQRAPRHLRSVTTAGSRSLLTRLSSAKTSVILYDKKMGAVEDGPAMHYIPHRPLKRQIYRTARTDTAHLVHPPDVEEREIKATKDDGMGHSRVRGGDRTGRPSPSKPRRGQPGGGREEGPAVPRGPPDREAGAIDCFLHHKAMVKSKHVKAKRDVRTNRSVGGGFLLSVCVTVHRSN